MGCMAKLPIGLTTKNDLKNAAKGIDEWVKLDGGNAYVLTNYKWVTVGNNSSTQLHVEFHTILCEQFSAKHNKQFELVWQ